MSTISAIMSTKGQLWKCSKTSSAKFKNWQETELIALVDAMTPKRGTKATHEKAKQVNERPGRKEVGTKSVEQRSIFCANLLLTYNNTTK